MSKTFEKVEELLATLEANGINSTSRLGDVLGVFKGKDRCKDFLACLKMFEIEKIKCNTISSRGKLSGLVTKCANLVK